MKNIRVQCHVLVLTVLLGLSAGKAQAGGQCSKGGKCGSSTHSDPQQRADQGRAKSKMEFATEIQNHGAKYQALLASESETEKATGAEFFTRLATNHKKVVETWVAVHHPELKKGTPLYQTKLEQEMGKDNPFQQ